MKWVLLIKIILKQEWDNGYWDNTKTCDDIFGHLKRDKLTWAVPEVIAAWVNAGKTKMWDNPEN